MRSAPAIRPSIASYQPVLNDWTYTMTEADAEYGLNKLGLRVTAPLNVPLCGGCDQPIVDGRCDDCELLFVEMLPAERIELTLRDDGSARWVA